MRCLRDDLSESNCVELYAIIYTLLTEGFHLLKG